MKKIITILILVFTLSCEEIINEQNITNNAINLLAPSENAVLKTGATIIFNWEALNRATDYQLQIAKPNFVNTNQIIKDTLVQRIDNVIEGSISTSNIDGIY